MTQEYFQIIGTRDIGTNYRVVTVHSSCVGTKEFRPGQCAKVNGRWLAAAGVRMNELDFVVKKDSFLLREQISSIEFPLGVGFPYIEDPCLWCIAAGTGLGAFTSLVSHRKNLGLSTVVQLYARNINARTVSQAFPQLNTQDFSCWDTSVWGRPNLEREVLSTIRAEHVLFAGPDSMLKEMRAIPKCPVINLNF